MVVGERELRRRKSSVDGIGRQPENAELLSPIAARLRCSHQSTFAAPHLLATMSKQFQFKLVLLGQSFGSFFQNSWLMLP